MGVDSNQPSLRDDIGLAAVLCLDDSVELTESSAQNTKTYCFHHKSIGMLGSLSVTRRAARSCKITATVASHHNLSVQNDARSIFNPIAGRGRDLLLNQRNPLQSLPCALDFTDLPWALQSLNCPRCCARIALFAHGDPVSTEGELEKISAPIEAFFAQSKLPVWIVSEESLAHGATINNVWIKIARLNHAGRAHLVSIDNICRMISAKQKNHCG